MKPHHVKIARKLITLRLYNKLRAWRCKWHFALWDYCLTHAKSAQISFYSKKRHQAARKEYYYAKRLLASAALLFTFICCAPVPAPIPAVQVAQADSLSQWNRLKMAIAMTESMFRTDAVGTKHDSGILQITPIYVADVNRITGCDYDIEDAFDTAASLRMFEALQAHYNPERDIDKAIYYHNKSKSYKRRVMENLAFIERYESFRQAVINSESK